LVGDASAIEERGPDVEERGLVVQPIDPVSDIRRSVAHKGPFLLNLRAFVIFEGTSENDEGASLDHESAVVNEERAFVKERVAVVGDQSGLDAHVSASLAHVNGPLVDARVTLNDGDGALPHK
jgi:hypothetical protein